jgi:hypothetical protein
VKGIGAAQAAIWDREWGRIIVMRTHEKFHRAAGGWAIALSTFTVALSACDNADPEPPATETEDGVSLTRPMRTEVRTDMDAGALPANQAAEREEIVIVPEYRDPIKSANSAGQADPPVAFLKGSEIRTRLLGYEITDGVHWGMAFRPNGRLSMSEDGEVQQGTWRIKKNQMCLRLGSADSLCHDLQASEMEARLWRDGAIALDGWLERIKK